MVVESGETTTQALARSKSAAARIVRSAVPGSGLRAYRVLMECKVRKRINFGRAPHVIDGGTDYQFRSPVLRSAIGINDYGSFAGKALENSCLNGPDDGLNGLGIVMGRQADQDVDFADVDELAKKIIRQERLFRQFNLPARF